MNAKTYNPGDVVLIRGPKEPLVCTVLRTFGPAARAKGRGLEVLTEEDKAQKIPADRVLVRLHGQIELGGRRKEIVGHLRKIHETIRLEAHRFDLTDLWDLLAGDTEGPMGWQELASFHGVSEDPMERAAFVESLYLDRLHFRQKKEGAFEPRRPEEVAQLVTQQERERARAEAREAFVAFAQACIQVGPDSSTGHDAVPLEAFEESVDLLKGLALHDEAFPKRAEAISLLKAIGATEGGPKHAAFRVLVALGIWSEDEELCILRQGLETDFSERVTKLAESAEAFHQGTEGYEDLTHLPFVAIDDEDTTERDDAVTWDSESGLMLVAIADPTYFIEPRDPIDRAALRRGRTLYLPTRKILMIPSPLSEDKASLKAGQVRPAVVFAASVDSDGHVGSWSIARAAVRVAATLTYEETDHILEGRHSHPLAAQLGRLRDLAQALRASRIAAGAVDLGGPEIKVRVGPDGRIRIHRHEQSTASHVLVSEAMILANRLAAAFCKEREVPCVYASQDPPEGKLPDRSAFPSERSWFHAVRTKLKRAHIGTVPGPHAGLGVEGYCQASSPLRRYSDLQILHQIGHYLKAGRPLLDLAAMQTAAAAAERSAAEATACERESKRYWLLKYLQRTAADRPLAAEIVAEAHEGGHIAELEETLVTVKIPPMGLELGQRVWIVLEQIDPRRDVIVARVADKGP